MKNTTQAASEAKNTFLMLLLCLVLGLPAYRSGESSFVFWTFVTAPAILGGLLVWQLVQWIRGRKQSGAHNMQSPSQG
jgi:hypothetical protein